MLLFKLGYGAFDIDGLCLEATQISKWKNLQSVGTNGCFSIIRGGTFFLDEISNELKATENVTYVCEAFLASTVMCLSSTGPLESAIEKRWVFGKRNATASTAGHMNIDTLNGTSA